MSRSGTTRRAGSACPTSTPSITSSTETRTMSSRSLDTGRAAMRGTEIAFVEHGQYSLWHPGTMLPFAQLDSPTDKLLHLSESDEGGVIVRTGTIDGPVSMTVETFDQSPAAPDDSAEWEHVEDLVVVS